MSFRTKALAGVMAASVAAAGIAIPFIKPHEGRELVAYRDTGNVWTICDGETLGVRQGDTRTHQECDAITKARVTEFAIKVDELVIPAMPPQTHAAFTSFAYNVGINNFAASTALKKLNRGDFYGACDQITRWVYVAGKDCRVRSNQCYGIVKRRAEERALCLAGLEGQPI